MAIILRPDPVKVLCSLEHDLIEGCLRQGSPAQTANVVKHALGVLILKCDIGRPERSFASFSRPRRSLPPMFTACIHTLAAGRAVIAHHCDAAVEVPVIS